MAAFLPAIQEIREKRGLCYSIYAFSSSSKHKLALGVCAGTSEDDAGQIAPVIAGEVAGLAENVTEAEIARPRQMKSSMLMGLERPGTRGDDRIAHVTFNTCFHRRR